ncbi:MAG: hypothetical protein LBB43_06930 [Spirochaetaceae bacterium]|jgi:hypothetical protein|nr:hypothetical protein [Spirochaetaceae bacterium]
MSILSKLRETSVPTRTGAVRSGVSQEALDEFVNAGVKFAASHPNIENIYYRAVHDLMNCIVTSVSGTPMLMEGSVYIGCWLESTGTINTELLSRFCPKTAQATFELFADYIRADGLIPYKMTSAGPGYRQVQMVSPLARSVWNHYACHKDPVFLKKMYQAIAANDQWLAAHRNTRATGCVEAFCTFDTGQDASPRFWHVPDTPYQSDPSRYDPDNPLLPFLAPDMTANVYCQRKYLARMAQELNEDLSVWEEKASQSLKSLMHYCYDEEDRFFYDRDRYNRFVKVQSDNLIRVLACEVGDDALFADALSRYLLNTKKYFGRYPINTFAFDDPRFFHLPGFNSWSGHISFLTEIRLPAAFEYHRRFVELTWILAPILSMLSRFTRFSGGLNPWVGHITGAGDDNYSPTMLCVLDYIERFCGIYPSADQELWFTALIPRGIDYGEVVAEETGYSRTVDNACFELTNEQAVSCVYKNGALLYSFPYGIRLVTDRSGALRSIIGMTVQTIGGEVRYNDQSIPFSVSGNERLQYTGAGFISVENPGVIPPNYG